MRGVFKITTYLIVIEARESVEVQCTSWILEKYDLFLDLSERSQKKVNLESNDPWNFSNIRTFVGVRGREDGGGPRRVPQELLLLQALRQGRRLLQLRQPQGTEI